MVSHNREASLKYYKIKGMSSRWEKALLLRSAALSSDLISLRKQFKASKRIIPPNYRVQYSELT